RICVGETLALRLRERGLLDQHALALVASSGAAEADNDRIERRVLSGTARERGISAGQEHELIEIGTAHAKRPLFLHAEKASLPELGLAFRAGRLADDRKHHDPLVAATAPVGRGGRAFGLAICRFCHFPRSHERRPLTSRSDPSPWCRRRRTG